MKNNQEKAVQEEKQTSPLLAIILLASFIPAAIRLSYIFLMSKDGYYYSGAPETAIYGDIINILSAFIIK